MAMRGLVNIQGTAHQGSNETSRNGVLERMGAGRHTNKTEKKALKCFRFCPSIGSRFNIHLGQISISILKLRLAPSHWTKSRDKKGRKESSSNSVKYRGANAEHQEAVFRVVRDVQIRGRSFERLKQVPRCAARSLRDDHERRGARHTARSGSTTRSGYSLRGGLA